VEFIVLIWFHSGNYFLRIFRYCDRSNNCKNVLWKYIIAE